MSTEIVKLEQQSIIANDQELHVGMCLQDSHGEIVEILRFEMYLDKYLHIVVMDNGREHSITESSFKNYYTTTNLNYQSIQDAASKIISGEMDIAELQDKQESSEMGLMVMNADAYLHRKNQLASMEQKVRAIYATVKQKTDAIRSNINSIVKYYDKAIKKLNKIIFTLELFAGIEESIKQIQSGQPANDDEPIYLMQLMRFMDEEVGDPSNGGISYDSIEKFDDWLLSYNKFLGYHNYHLLLPHKKCVRIMRVRANVSAKYSRDPWNNQWAIQSEMQTYIIIRNGDNFYTISSQMKFSEKLFPDVDELTEFYERANNNPEIWHDDEKIEKYKHGMVLMQGLIERTTVLGNLSGKVSFLKSDSAEDGKVVFKYENDDKLITDGSMSSLDFLNTSTIEAGDRILLYNADIGYRADRIYKQYFQNEFSYPKAPEDGIYKLEYDSKNKCLFLKYNPKDTVYTRFSIGERKRGYSFKINPSDDNIVNIDIVSHRNIAWVEKMMYDRRDRKKYIRAAGLLLELRRVKKEEFEQEEPFKNMLMSVCKMDEETALDAIHWWKNKNKHKRPLFIDDQKALRMISKRFKSGEGFEL